MAIDTNTVDFKDTEILLMKNELKKFVQRMQAEGFLRSVNIDETLKMTEAELELPPS